MGERSDHFGRRHHEAGNCERLSHANRIAACPPGYLLAHDSGDIARHCELLEPLPAPGEVRALVAQHVTGGRTPIG